MTNPIAITEFGTLDEATREAWLDNLADLRSDAEDTVTLRRTCVWGSPGRRWAPPTGRQRPPGYGRNSE